MGSKGSNQVTQNKTQTFTPNPLTMQVGQQAANIAGNLPGPGAVPLQGIQGFSPDQIAAFQAARNAQGVASPFLASANQYIQQGSSPFDTGAVGDLYNKLASPVFANLADVFGQQNVQNTAGLRQAAGGPGAERIGVAQANLAKEQGLAAGQTGTGLLSQAINSYLQQKQLQQAGGSLMGQLGGAAQGAAYTDINALLGTGGLQQQLGQAGLGALYAQQTGQYQNPYQNLAAVTGLTGTLGPALGGTTTGTATTTYPQTSPLAYLPGLAMTGAGLFGSQGAFPNAIPNAWNALFPPQQGARGGRINPYASGGAVEEGHIGEGYQGGGSIDQDYINRLFQIESGGNPYARTGSNRGLGQFGPTEERMYGINASNRHLPAVQAAAVQREAGQHGPSLAETLGRQPTPAEMYLAHQQGLAGAKALLSNPNMPAWQAIRPYYRNDAIAKQAITGNIPYDHPLKRIGVDQIPSSAFSQMWADKWNRVKPQDISPTLDAGSPVAGTQNMASASPLPNVPSPPTVPKEWPPHPLNPSQSSGPPGTNPIMMAGLQSLQNATKPAWEKYPQENPFTFQGGGSVDDEDIPTGSPAGTPVDARSLPPEPAPEPEVTPAPAPPLPRPEGVSPFPSAAGISAAANRLSAIPQGPVVNPMLMAGLASLAHVGERDARGLPAGGGPFGQALRAAGLGGEEGVKFMQVSRQQERENAKAALDAQKALYQAGMERLPYETMTEAEKVRERQLRANEALTLRQREETERHNREVELHNQMMEQGWGINRPGGVPAAPTTSQTGNIVINGQEMVPGKTMPEGTHPEALVGHEDVANWVMGIVEGRENPANVPFRLKPVVMKLVNQVDPKWDQTAWTLRNKTNADWAPNGKSGQSMASFNFALRHTADLGELTKGLNPSQMRILNSTVNWMKTQFSDPQLEKWRNQALIVATEVPKMLRGAGVLNQQEEARWNERLMGSANANTFLQGIGQVGHAMNVRNDEMIDQYRQIMKKDPPYTLSKSAQAARDQLEQWREGKVRTAREEAMDWIRDNPNDPRIPELKKRLEIP